MKHDLKLPKYLGRRIFATIFDYSIYIAIFVSYVLFLGEPNDEGGKTVTGVIGFIPFIFWLIYFVIPESFQGSTLGHYLVDLKVVNLDGTKILFRQALKRRILDLIDILFYGIPAFIAVKNSDRNQRIGDMWAKTLVVHKSDIDYLKKYTTNSDMNDQ